MRAPCKAIRAWKGGRIVRWRVPQGVERGECGEVHKLGRPDLRAKRLALERSQSLSI
jgi:hypothetical protein